VKNRPDVSIVEVAFHNDRGEFLRGLSDNFGRDDESKFCDEVSMLFGQRMSATGDFIVL
jgi:hypothetical protein